MQSNAVLQEQTSQASDQPNEILDAISRAFATIEFQPDGTIIAANDNFLKTLGYTLNDIIGQHHRMFVEPAYANSLEYRRFWDDLAHGKVQTKEFKRLTKAGQPVWINASYMPVTDGSGQVVRIIKLAQDATKQRLEATDLEGKLNAINKSQAVIEFNLDGTIITANDNFLSVVGYSLSDIQGKHHSMFVEENDKRSNEYRIFWERLNRGEFQTAEYKRVGKGGKEVWIQASYNPIMDFNGKPFKVVKYATETTQQKIRNADYEGQLAAISKSQAVIEFNLDGTILKANDNFLAVVGYSASEIIGKHHSMFADESLKRSPEYKMFWEKLNRGEYDAAQYKRIAKGGKEVWIQASYNPIMDLNGKPFKVVKYATDITAQMNLLQELKALSAMASQLANASQSLNNSANQMVADSKQTTNQASEATAAADRVSKAVNVVATNTEEMQASIKEIARNANEASNMTNETRSQAQATNLTIQKLGESSKEIGNVIKVISSIAQQTNLLALNATIEAARAGDAGRGFAVVANEVKELAKQTAKATEEITNKIGAIQTDSSDAVKAISTIGNSIEKINAIAGAIAASVEEQAATTSEVARVVMESNTEVQVIAGNIKAVSASAGQTTSGASTVLDATKDLQGLASALQDMAVKLQRS